MRGETPREAAAGPRRLFWPAALFASVSCGAAPACGPAPAPEAAPDAGGAGAPRPVSYARLTAAEANPEEWLTYSGNYRSERFTRLDRITPGNVAGLRPAWVHQIPRGGRRMESTPLVADGVMYLVEPTSTPVALDAATGAELWRYDPRVPRDAKAPGYPRTNRGVALLGGSVFFGAFDGRAIALDRATGAPRWSVTIADNRLGYGITAAPLALDGLVVFGMSGGIGGARGFLDAFHAETGERAWRFWTVPAPGEPGGDTWGGGTSWETGGGATWLTGSHDPELGLLYWPTGNPAPALNGDSRPGDNLYTCSLLALDAATGRLRWHFQFTPHDTHDWDATQIPVLVDAVWDGEPRRLVILANRNGFFYVLDRETGEFLRATEFGKQTWAEGMDEGGRPILRPDTEPTEEGTLLWPTLGGATSWQSPAYDPDRRTLFVATLDVASRYYRSEPDYRPGEAFLAGYEESVGEPEGAFRALDLSTGAIRWEAPRPPHPRYLSLLATATGLLFSGDGDSLLALDSDTGERLWSFRAGGPLASGPISYALDGEQFVAAASGSAVFAFSLAAPAPRPAGR